MELRGGGVVTARTPNFINFPTMTGSRRVAPKINDRIETGCPKNQLKGNSFPVWGW